MSVANRIARNLVVWFLVGYAGTWLAYLAFTVLPGGEALRERRGFALQHVLKMSRPLLDPARAKELSHYLQDAASTGLVDYFEVAARGHTESAGIAPPTRPLLTESLTESDGWVWGRAESAEVSVRLSSGYGWRTRLSRSLAEEATRVPFEAAFLIFAYSLSLWYQSAARRQAARGAVEAPLREARRKKGAATAKETGETGEFEGLCGRSTILNQAELLGAGDPEKFFASLEEFYADCAAALSRYKGQLHGVHGHELVFFFAEKVPALDARLAVSAARDLEELGARHGFRIGTALAAGRLHGAHLIAGYALFGAPVEETSELVQAISQAQRDSAIWLSEPVARAAGGSVKLRPARKGGAQVLAASPALAPALAKARESGEFAELAYHRGDAALAEILGSLLKEESWARDHYVGVVSELRRVPSRRCGPGVVEAYRALLTAELARKDTYRLSSVVALASTLLNRAVIDRTLERLLLQSVAVKDRRVRANAVELFTRFFPEREILELKPLIRDEDNRVSANALIKAACERFDEKVIGRIEERVRCGSVAHVASALHAMGEIAHYYRNHDPLFLGTKHSFLRLFDGVPAWAEHPNTMIRRQALIAAQKLQSETLDARLRELFATCQEAELLGLFATVYGWRKDAARDAA